MDRYVLSPELPVRALLIDSVCTLAGAVLFVVGGPLLTVLGVVVFGIGIGIVVAAVVATRRLQTVVDLDADGVQIRSAGRTERAPWAEITSVTADGRAIYLVREESVGPTLKIDGPRGSKDSGFQRLSAELTQRLDQSRGYRSF